MKEIYQVLSGAMGQELQLTQLANNLANISSVGFKQDRAVFDDVYARAMNAHGLDPKDYLGGDGEKSAAPAWPVLSRAYTDFSAGNLIKTGGDCDLAIRGAGFFSVKIEGQDRPLYTRAGNFQVNAANELVTENGDKVLDDKGSPVTLDPKLGRPVVTPKGEIMQGATTRAKLGVFDFADPQKLVKVGEGLYGAPEAVTASPAKEPNIAQGSIEGSNVNGVEEIVRMIQTQRAYETQQKTVQAIDEVTGRRIELSTR